jgi:hypothetical protein
LIHIFVLFWFDPAAIAAPMGNAKGEAALLYLIVRTYRHQESLGGIGNIGDR